MPLDSYGMPAVYGEDDEAKVTGILQGFSEKRTRRSNFDVAWQEISLIALPSHADTFFWGASPAQGTKKTQQQIDSSVGIAAHRFAALVNGLWTPSSSVWTRFYNTNDYVMQQPGVAEYYDALTRVVWTERYRAAAGFRQANLANMLSEGVYGNMNLFVDEADTRLTGRRGLRYKMLPVGSVWYEIDHQGQVCGFYMGERLTAGQIRQKWPSTFPPALQSALDTKSEEKHEIVQYVGLRADWSPYRVDAKGMRYMSCVVSVRGRCILEEKGFRTFPLATGRYMVAPGEDYARGPGQMILASGKTKNAQKSVFLQQGHRAGDPIYLTTEDAPFELDRYPGAVNRAGLTADGVPLARMLETGNIQITKEMMDEEGRIIGSGFLLDLFGFALDTANMPNLNTRQVFEMIEQRALFLAPATDGPHDEYLGNLVPREIDVLSYLGLLPPKPPALVEALKDEGIEDYEVEFTNPMTRTMQAGESAAAMQMVEAAAQIANSSQDSSVWRTFSFKRLIRGMARNRGMRPDWLATPQEIVQADQAAAQAAAREQRAKEMPARASIIKAQAVAAKAQTGGNIGGTLSGVPQSQMPEIPGEAPGMPGMANPFGGPGTPGRAAFRR